MPNVAVENSPQPIIRHARSKSGGEATMARYRLYDPQLNNMIAASYGDPKQPLKAKGGRSTLQVIAAGELDQARCREWATN